MIARELVDQEFGIVKIRRVARARHIKLKIDAVGTLSASMPRLAPLFLLKQLVDSSRPALRKALNEPHILPATIYHDGDRVGASHHIRVQPGIRSSARISGQEIIWTLKTGSDPMSTPEQAIVRKAVRRALDQEAKAYLSRRLSYLAAHHGFSYATIRYSNAKGRWGSCSAQGVISLNVALMNLPMELIDYVLIHELAHTKHLNHSPTFWSAVATSYPEYKAARKSLKSCSPYL